MPNFKQTLLFDFDGVIAKYDGWKGFDVFGEPNEKIIEAMHKLKDKYAIVIFTTRPATEKMIQWLEKNNVPYDDINRNGHNPIMTSVKPISVAIIDDRAINYHGQEADKLIEEVEKLVGGE